MVSTRRLLTMQAYRQTLDGKAAAKRSHQNYVNKRRDDKAKKLTFDTLAVSGFFSTKATK